MAYIRRKFIEKNFREKGTETIAFRKQHTAIWRKPWPGDLPSMSVRQGRAFLLQDGINSGRKNWV